jgi:hypothetical protein
MLKKNYQPQKFTDGMHLYTTRQKMKEFEQRQTNTSVAQTMLTLELPISFANVSYRRGGDHHQPLIF